MRTITRAILAAGLAISAGPAYADDEKLSIDKLPGPVQGAIKAQFPKADLVSAAKETEGDVTTYEVAITSEGRAIDLALSPDGKIREIEAAIKAEDLPEGIAAALSEKHPKFKVTKAEELLEVRDGKLASLKFEILLTGPKEKTLEVVVAREWVVAKKEAAEPEKAAKPKKKAKKEAEAKGKAAKAKTEAEEDDAKPAKARKDKSAKEADDDDEEEEMKKGEGKSDKETDEEDEDDEADEKEEMKKGKSDKKVDVKGGKAKKKAGDKGTK